MSAFNLDESLNNVKYLKTKIYLGEVVSSYYNGNYRSCIVVLYLIVIFDIYHKLKILAEIYNDKKAQNAMKEIEDIRNNSEKLSNWENTVLKKSFDDTQLFNQVEKEQIEQLKKYRNWSAHPIVDNNYDLISPTKEAALFHIRNMFEAVFEKDAILSKKILGDLLDDVKIFCEREGFKSFSQDFGELQRFVESKYLKYFNEHTTKNIFKSLWTIVFSCEDPDINEYRIGVLMTLSILTKKNKTLLLKYFKENNQELNNKIEIPTHKPQYENSMYKLSEFPISSFVYFLSVHKEFYDMILDHKKIEIENYVRPSINLYALSYFLSEDLGNHFNNIKQKVLDNFQKGSSGFSEWGFKYCALNDFILLHLFELSKKYAIKKEFITFIINYLLGAPQFSSVNAIWNIISKILCEFDSYDYDELMNCMNTNPEVYANQLLDNILEEVLTTAKKLGKTIDIRSYKFLCSNSKVYK